MTKEPAEKRGPDVKYTTEGSEGSSACSRERRKEAEQMVLPLALGSGEGTKEERARGKGECVPYPAFHHTHTPPPFSSLPSMEKMKSLAV